MTRKSGYKVTLALMLILFLVMSSTISAIASTPDFSGSSSSDVSFVARGQNNGRGNSDNGNSGNNGNNENRGSNNNNSNNGNNGNSNNGNNGNSNNGNNGNDGNNGNNQESGSQVVEQPVMNHTATIHLSDQAGKTNGNNPMFDSKQDVYISFGAQLPGSESDNWIIQVLAPGNKDQLLGTATVSVVPGQKYLLWDLVEFADTTNSGGVYKVIAYWGDASPEAGKSKNFKINPASSEEEEGPKDPTNPGTGEPGEGDGGSGGTEPNPDPNPNAPGETDTEGTTEENGGGGSDPGTNPGTGGTGGSTDDGFAVFEDDEVPLSSGEMPVLPEEEEKLTLVPEDELVMEDDAVPLALPKTGGAADGLMVVPLLMTLAGYVVARKRF